MGLNKNSRIGSFLISIAARLSRWVMLVVGRTWKIEIVAAISGKEVADLEPGLDLVADLGIDSPKALQMLLDLEDALGIEISDEDAAKMDSVGDVLDYLGSLA